MIPALIIAVLIFLNGIFVAAEFAIIGAPKPAVERAAASGNRIAQRLLAIIRDARAQDRYIATAQLGITLASLGLGMYGEHVLAEALVEPLGRLGIFSMVTVHSLASVLSVGFLTYLHIVLGEMIPKTLALQHPLPTALRINTLMRVMNWCLYLAVVLLNTTGNLFLRLFGVRRNLDGQAPTPEHLRFIVAESMAGGHLDSDAGEVLAELFDFGERTAVEVMTPRVHIVGLRKGASAVELRELLKGRRHTRYPVYDGTMDRIVGIVLIRDLLEPLLEEKPLSDELIRPVPFVPETSRLDRVLSVMRFEKTQLVVVMDEFGGTAGIVTVEDLFEEVVGEIADGQTARLPMDWVGDEVRAQGFVRLDELGEELDRDLEHPEVDTISGLVLFLLDRPPEVGDVVEWERLTIRVVSVEGHGVKEVRVRQVGAKPASD